MRVRDGMSTMVLTVGPNHTLRQAAHAMAKRRVGAAVVVDPEAPTLGIITERDILLSIGDGQDPDAELVAAVDGLGHGGAAADAAEAAAEQFHRHAGEAPETLLRNCHQALRATRGVVATIAWFDLETAGLTWTGVGNVEGRLVRADRERGDSIDSPTLFGGVLGWSLPGVKLVRTTLAPGDCVVMATDGVAADFGSSLIPGASAQEQAERVLASHSRGSDDALVVAVRWMPSASVA
jgi:CBS domain-containing protein